MAELNPLDTFRIDAINLYREGTAEDQKFDIRPFVYELAIHEDMFSGTIFGHLVLLDFINLPESFPIVGSELVDIRFRTPTYTDSQLITMCVGKVGKRIVIDQTNKQSYKLSLITQDRYTDYKLNISKAYDGTYDTIVQSLITDLRSTVPLDKDTANYNQTFICPYWSPLKACKWIASRAYGEKNDPFFFWQTMDGYNFKSAYNIYNQEPYASLIIEPSRISDDGDRIWRRVQRYEYMESADRMRQIQTGAYGLNMTVLDTVNKTVEEQQFDYKVLSGNENFAKIAEYPLVPEVDPDFFNYGFMYSRSDKSHEGEVYRNMLMNFIDYYRIKVVVAGDSGYKAGQIINLNVPDFSSSANKYETLTSGRWLILSLCHLIRDGVYTTSLELCKDSFSADVRSEIGMVEVSNTEKKTTEVKDQPKVENAPAAKLIPDA